MTDNYEDAYEYGETDALNMDDPEREARRPYAPAQFVAACNRHDLDPDQTFTEASWTRLDRQSLPPDVYAAFDLLDFDPMVRDQRDWQRMLITEAVDHPEWAV